MATPSATLEQMEGLAGDTPTLASFLWTQGESLESLLTVLASSWREATIKLDR